MFACHELPAARTTPRHAAPACVERSPCSRPPIALAPRLDDAASRIDGRDRKRLERVARYLLRPAFALDAISATADGRVRVVIARRGRCVTMTPDQLLAKLAAWDYETDPMLPLGRAPAALLRIPIDGGSPQ